MRIISTQRIILYTRDAEILASEIFHNFPFSKLATWS